ncbi:DMT family transporter [Vibrio penaeicida]|uniref:DMT family transporter n=1 Tax=Vibrio penaeicida TaxID=104609 RepID=UPI000F836422|nr:DMT family transporter [Vibrio penaeicida]RTZ23972.1 DMT family transporter [Vibrio penaeicida]
MFFMLLDAKNGKKTLQILKDNKKDILGINISTLANTVLAYYVMTHVPPTVYVIVFFSCLPLFEHLLSRKRTGIRETAFLFKLAVFVSSLLIAGFVSTSDANNTAIGIVVTMISSLFAVIYMKQTSKLHQEAEATIFQVLTLRFILVSLLCGTYAFSQGTISELSSHEIGLILFTAFTGSIIPLFLMQLSIKKLGGAVSALFTPIIPVFCMIMMLVLGYLEFSALEMLLVTGMSFMIFYQAKLDLNKKEGTSNA